MRTICWLGGSVVAGTGSFGYLLGAAPRAECDGAAMRPGDDCLVVLDGIRTYRNFDEATAHSAGNLAAFRLYAVLVVVLALTLLAVVLWKSGQDRRLLARLRHDRGEPVSVHSATADVSVVVVFLTLFAGLAAVAARSTELGPFSYPLAALAAGFFLWAFWIAFPRRGLLVQVFDAGIRLVAAGRVHDLPWTDLRLEETVAATEESAPSYALSAPGIGRVELPEDLTDLDGLLGTLRRDCAR